MTDFNDLPIQAKGITLKDLLEESHKDLHLWFLLHQECLVANYESDALQALKNFQRILLFHLDFEEQRLLKHNNDATRWPVSVYQKEHDKIKRQLDKLIVKTQSYLDFSGRKKRHALISLIEDQLRFYHLLEHHEEREEQDLFLFLPEIPIHVWASPYQILLDSFSSFKENVVRKLE
jgi:hypothetical protein